MLDDDLLRQLHHVLLEVSYQPTPLHFTIFSNLTTPCLDTHRRWFHDMSKLRPRLSDLEWNPKYGPHLTRFSSNCHRFSSFSRFSYWQSTRLGSDLRTNAAIQ